MFDVVIEILHGKTAENHMILDHTRALQHSARWSEDFHPFLLLRIFGPPTPELAVYFSKEAFNIIVGQCVFKPVFLITEQPVRANLHDDAVTYISDRHF